MKNKNAKKLVLSFALLALAGAMASASTFAWFSMNKTVGAKGMSVNAQSSESLVISKSVAFAKLTEVTFHDDDLHPTLVPTTHHETAASGLAYMDGGVTDVETGANTGGTLTAAANGGADTYFVDYVLYVAAEGGTLTTSGLVLEFDEATIAEMRNATKEFNKRYTTAATTVDVYVDKFDSASAPASPVAPSFAAGGNYKGKLCLADILYASAPSITIYSGQIPQVGSGFLRVTLRTYIDGAKTYQPDYAKADFKDSLFGTGSFESGTTYYTFNAGAYEAVGSPVAGSLSSYYVNVQPKKAGACYVNTSHVVTEGIEFGVVFNA